MVLGAAFHIVHLSAFHLHNNYCGHSLLEGVSQTYFFSVNSADARVFSHSRFIVHLSPA